MSLGGSPCRYAHGDLSWRTVGSVGLARGRRRRRVPREAGPGWVHERAQARQIGPGRRPPHRRMDTIGRWSVAKKLGSGARACKSVRRFRDILGPRAVVRTTASEPRSTADRPYELGKMPIPKRSASDVEHPQINLWAWGPCQAPASSSARGRASRPLTASSTSGRAPSASWTPVSAVRVAKLRPIRSASTSVGS